jgi:hypothetical protein
MDDEARLSFLGRRVRPPFEVRWISVEPGAERTCDGAEWLGALVVVELGSIEVEVRAASGAASRPAACGVSAGCLGAPCGTAAPASSSSRSSAADPTGQTDEFPADRGRSGDGVA